MLYIILEKFLCKYVHSKAACVYKQYNCKATCMCFVNYSNISHAECLPYHEHEHAPLALQRQLLNGTNKHKYT